MTHAPRHTQFAASTTPLTAQVVGRLRDRPPFNQDA
jgi:hypothetical protein